jgi:hypothetical protein
MKKLFLAAAGAFGAIPGLVVIQKGIGTPPGYNVLFGGVIEAFGALALCLLLVNNKKIKKLKERKVIRISIGLAVLCFVSLALYLTLYNLCVVTHDARGTAYYPLWLSGEIAEMVNSAGSRWAAIEEYGIGAVLASIAKMPSVALSITTVVILFVYQTVFTSLTLAFGVAGVHKETDGESSEPGPKAGR